MYNECLIDHNLHPHYKNGVLPGSKKCTLVNASCGDKFDLFLKIENNTIVDGSFTGSGCAISQASVDLMLEQIIGKNIDEVKKLAAKFGQLIQTGKTQSDLGEANALVDVSKMPARVKCAELAWSWLNR